MQRTAESSEPTSDVKMLRAWKDTNGQEDGIMETIGIIVPGSVCHMEVFALHRFGKFAHRRFCRGQQRISGPAISCGACHDSWCEGLFPGQEDVLSGTTRAHILEHSKV